MQERLGGEDSSPERALGPGTGCSRGREHAELEIWEALEPTLQYDLLSEDWRFGLHLTPLSLLGAQTRRGRPLCSVTQS